MHVAIDYTAAVRQQAGIGRYTRNLVRTLADLDAQNQYTLYVAGGWGQGDRLGPWPANFRVRSIPVPDRVTNILWQRLRIPVPIQMITGRFDLFHSPDFVLPYAGRAPTLLTVHDLSFLRVPQHFVPGFREYLEKAVSRAVGRASHILADSESTRSDLTQLMGVDREKVSVVYPGVDSRFSCVDDPELLAKVRERYQLPPRFILGLSTIQPRKNFDGLIDAFQILLSEAADKVEVANLDLVICGGFGWMYEDTLQRVQDYGLGDRVHFPGFVRDEDLPAVYSMASVFAFPSWYEGFGLPVLEAMACGTPVIAADNSSLPEVVGDGGLMVDASRPGELAAALVNLLTDHDLRSVLREAAFAQAARFTWTRAAHALLATYERLGSSSTSYNNRSQPERTGNGQ